ncbi:MAG: peptidylprolyl isomerase [Paludibacteraceae bacterium]|nr:peptidylprolyl isomerase [Paludibacteraceae bacterium]
MRRLSFIVVLLVAAIGFALAKGKVVDQVVWVVGDEPVLQSEIEGEIIRLKYEKQTVDGDPYCVIPEQIAIQKLFIAQAKIDSVVVSETVLDQQVDARVKYFIQRIGSQEKVEEYFGKPIDKIKSEMRRTVNEQMVVSQMQQKITDAHKITPADVLKFYNKIPKDSIPTIPEQVEVQIISISPEVTPVEVERIKSKLREFKEKVESGESQFSTLAILYSEDRGSAMQGGELGFMTKGKLVPEFANVAFSLFDPTKVSRIVESEFGYHIIQLIERRNDQVNCRHILMIPHIEETQKREAMAKLDSLATAIRTEKLTFAEATMQYSEDKETKENGGLMINPETMSNKFQIQQLPAEVAKVVYNLSEGEISKPFVYKTPAGKDMVCIVKLKSRTKAHKANPEEDFNELTEIVSAKRSKELIDKWIEEKQRELYIHVNPELRSCPFKYPGWIKE